MRVLAIIFSENDLFFNDIFHLDEQFTTRRPSPFALSLSKGSFSVVNCSASAARASRRQRNAHAVLV
jgi:hypothetical protein